MDPDNLKTETAYTFQESSEPLFSIQILEFKTSLLEAVEELRMGRVAKGQYEEQISKILLEKQELVWQNGQFQLVAETKGREINGLKEDLKSLQMSNYSLQKKLQEMEQKVQLHMLAKEDHIKQLSEFEKCFATITRQFAAVKGVHEKLEQNVQEAKQQNLKLRVENKRKETEISHLKEELKKGTSDLIKYKVARQQQTSEEKMNLTEKEQQLRQLQQRLQVETEINKQLKEENLSTKEEKQEIMRSLNHMSEIIQRHTQTIQCLENELSTLKEKQQVVIPTHSAMGYRLEKFSMLEMCFREETLERDNELQRAKAKEDEEKFLALQLEHKEAFETSQIQRERVSLEMDKVKEELERTKKAYNELQERHSELYCEKYKDTEKVIHTQEHLKTQQAVLKDSDDEYTKWEDKITHNEIITIAECKEDCSSTVKFTEDGDLLNKEGKRRETDSENQNVGDKTSFSEEEKSESSPSRNKVNSGFTEESVNESGGKSYEDIPCWNTNDACGERYSQCTSCIQVPAFVESVKLLLDNNKPSTVCSGDGSQQTDSSNHKFGDATRKGGYEISEKADTVWNEKGVLINEPHKQESKWFPETKEGLIHKPVLDKEKSASGRSKEANGYQSNVQKCNTPDMDTVMGSDEQNKQWKTEQIQLGEENHTRLCTDILQDKCTKEPSVVESGDGRNKPDGNISTMCNIECKAVPSRNYNRATITRLITNPMSQNYGSPTPLIHQEVDDITRREGVSGPQTSIQILGKKKIDTSATVNISHLDLEEIDMETIEDSDTKRSKVIGGAELHMVTHNASVSPCTEQVDEMINVVQDHHHVQDGAGEPQESRKVTSMDEHHSNKVMLPGSVNVTETISDTVLDTLNYLSRINQRNDQPIKVLLDKPSFTMKDIQTDWSGDKWIPMKGNNHNVATKTQGPTMRQEALTAPVHPAPRRDHSSEWREIAQTFQDSCLSTEHTLSDVAGRLQNSSMSNKTIVVIPIAVGHRAVHENQTTMSPEIRTQEESGSIHSSIKDHINQIERFLSDQKLTQPKKRKREEEE
ncbi:coiled-coil domain-containing protein 73 [Discoglossus pictus]